MHQFPSSAQNRLARRLWFLITGLVVALFALGVRPAFTAILAPADSPSSGSLTAIAHTLASRTAVSPAIFALYGIAVRGLMLAILICIGYLIVRQQRRQPFYWFNWFVPFFMISFGATMAQDVLAFGTAVLAPSAFDASVEVINSLGWLLFVTFLYLFPDGRFVPRWAALGLIGWWILWFVPEDVPLAFVFGVFALIIGAISLVFRYVRVATSRKRRQMKWVVLGLALFLTLIFAALFIVSDTDLLNEINTLLSGIIPVSIGIAMVRGQLWDVEVVIRKTLVYAMLTGLLALVYFGCVVLLQQVFGRLTGVEQSPLAIVGSTLLIAALFTPLRQRIQEWIDRRFFRRKYDTQQVLARFALTARDETDLDLLLAKLVRVVQETMQPDQVSVSLRHKE